MFPISPDCSPGGNATSLQEIQLNLCKSSRLSTFVDNHGTLMLIRESAGFLYQFRSVIHIRNRASGQDVRPCGYYRSRGINPPHSRAGNLPQAQGHIKKILFAPGKIFATRYGIMNYENIWRGAAKSAAEMAKSNARGARETRDARKRYEFAA